jgi:phosphoribosylamine--glycine ligase
MNVLIIGSGAREHALAITAKRSPRLRRLYVAPGNDGIARDAEIVRMDVADHAAVIDFCRLMAIDLVVVGPEAPLVAGIADDLAEVGIACFGPGREAARLEGSKGYAKDFCREFGIPTSDYRRLSERKTALAYVRERGAPIVVKADGLAAGKGVVVAMTRDEAEGAVRALFDADENAEVVIEDYIDGEEISFFALCDGERAIAFSCAQDHKRVGEGDTGPNTGGMGAYSPAPILTEALSARIMREIIEPTVAGMRRRGTPFRGVLFAGLMIGRNGPKLIEYNVRFGDPEAEVLLTRLDVDLLGLLAAAAAGRLPDASPRFRAETALTVVMAANGYPGTPEKGTRIGGVDEASTLPGVTVHFGGVRRRGSDLLADGGRVLAVTALGADVAEARARAYAGVDAIDWPGGFCRRDIGWRAIGKPTSSQAQ